MTNAQVLCLLCTQLPKQSHSVPFSSVIQIQYQRDAEIARLKKHYLDIFLSKPLSLKRSRSLDSDYIASPRPKFRRVSIDLWKEACQSADDSYDVSLPTLEEAATLFGFAKS